MPVAFIHKGPRPEKGLTHMRPFAWRPASLRQSAPGGLAEPALAAVVIFHTVLNMSFGLAHIIWSKSRDMSLKKNTGFLDGLK